MKFIQVEQAKFGRFRFWSHWVDVCVFQHGYGGYLLQMQVNRFNLKRFRAAPFKSARGSAHAEMNDVRRSQLYEH